MKKLMVVAAVAFAALYANAAAYTWKATSGYLYDGTGGSAEANKITSGTAYLFNAGTYSQDTLLKAIAGGSTLENLAKANAVNYTGSAFIGGTVGSDARIAESASFTYSGVAAGNTWTGYFALVVGDKVYVSSAKTGILASELAEGTAIGMGAMSTNSKSTIGAASAGYSSAGWYTTVPEPTSGLMLLLGVGLMALKRRRA